MEMLDKSEIDEPKQLAHISHLSLKNYLLSLSDDEADGMQTYLLIFVFQFWQKDSHHCGQQH